MGLAPEYPSKDITNISCYLPTSQRNEASDLSWQYRSIQLCCFKNHLETNEKHDASRESIVLTCWAILLKSYTGSEVVSFANLRHVPYNDVACETPRPKETIACHVLHYEVDSNARIQDIGVHLSQQHDLVNPEPVLVNTAVLFSESISVCSGGDNGRGFSVGDMEMKAPDQFDLILDFQHATLDYHPSHVSEEYATTIAHHFASIFKNVMSNKDLLVSQVVNLNERGVQNLLSWNPQDPFAEEKQVCVHELFHLKARETPNAEAVCGWDGSLTYKILNEYSDIAAAQLAVEGVRPGSNVPFACEKSIWAVVVALGILKAGAALVPINPNDPASRLEEILRSVEADVVATTSGFASTFQRLGVPTMVFSKESCLRASPVKQREPFTYREIVSPSDPIFVLFTSGSTGRPKGMIHTHTSIATHALTHGAAMSYLGARVLQFSAYTFDVALIDIFTTLLFGGCICMPSESDRKSNIINVMNSMRVDHTILTPSFAGLIDPAEVPMLKTLAVGGEALPQDRVKTWADKVNLIQIYGPAEAGICLAIKMHSDMPGALVGFPLDNSSCWLVDPDNESRLVPIGAVGELLVAGPSLASGYLNDEARTQLSFIEAPAWAKRIGLPFKKFYKTGDLLRYDIDAFDGSFLFVGRKDSQIKLRGQRIEAGEVEYHIGHLPGVAFSVVAKPDKGCFAGQLIAVVQLKCADGSGVRLLDGDILLTNVQHLTIEDVRCRLEKVLPSYMLPTACFVIDNMPFVPSLKIDRRRVHSWLVAMKSGPCANNFATLSPFTPEETTATTLGSFVATLVATDKVLRLRLVNHDFRFHDIGMDSIKIVSLSIFLQREYSVTIPMEALLDPRTTIGELARQVDRQKAESTNEISTSVATASFQRKKINAHLEALALEESLLKGLQAASLPLTAAKGGHNPQNVLLTGAGGYLGSAILHQLLQIPEIQVFALMRCPSPAAALQRLQELATKDRWWKPEYRARITIWPGDLSLPDLGLSPGHQQQLAPTLVPCTTTPDDEKKTIRFHLASAPPIDTIIHAGANVHYTLPYTTLFPTNVTSTLTLLRSAAASPHVHTFIHVCGGESPDTDSLSTAPDYLASLSNTSGYTLTKNIAERVVRAAAGHIPFSPSPSPSLPTDTSPNALSQIFKSQNTRILTLRPGYIIGSAASNFRANTTDFLWRLLAGCIAIGSYDAAEQTRWVFVDDVRSVAARVVFPSSSQCVLTGLRFSAIWQVLEKVYAPRTFRALPTERWITELKKKVREEGEMGGLWPLLGVLEEDGGARVGVDGIEGVDGDGDEDRVKEVLEGNVRWLVGIGFLPAV